MAPLDAIAVINPTSGAANTIGQLPQPLRRLSCAVAPSSTVIYYLGGTDQTGSRTNAIVRYVR